MVPINVSNHDLLENYFSNRKLDNVTATKAHDEKNQYECDICGCRYESVPKLIKHISLKH